MRQAMDK